MANMYTKMIDEIFAKYGNDNSEILLLGYGHSGDEDGGTDDYVYYGEYYEVEPGQRGTDKHRQLGYDLDADLENDFERDYEDLCSELDSAFEYFVQPDLTCTNCYWYRYVFVTKDYKIMSIKDRGDINNGWTELFDINSLDEETADKAEDEQTMLKINSHVTSIHGYMYALKHVENKEQTKKLLQDLIDKL